MTTFTTPEHTDPDPHSARYSLDYQAGYRIGENPADGALERADGRGVSNAWHDGYMDAATGRPKWTYRVWRRNGCDATCGYDCGGPHRRTDLPTTPAAHGPARTR